MLRNGEVVGYPDRDLLQNTEALIAMMVGREIDQLYTPRQRPAADNGATPLLSVRQLSDGRQLQDLSFDIQPGEIVGVAGLLGAGRDVLVDLLYGLRPAERGTIHLEGRPRRIRTPKQAIRAGMALVPRDRRHQGLILPFTTADNINLASLPERHLWLGAAGYRRAESARLDRTAGNPPGTPGAAGTLHERRQPAKSDPRPLAGDRCPAVYSR